jgi:hypothetical protein
MQQLESWFSIMTTRFRSGFTACMAALALGACAALPDDAPVVEQLDGETGATVTRFGHAFELYRETFVQASGVRFAFIGPFETNQMGRREQFLWIAVPFETPADPPPVLEVDGAALALGTPSRSADVAGLRAPPYKIPTPWSAMYYYRIDATLLARLRDARSLTLRVLEATKDGSLKIAFSAQVGDDPRFREFAARVAAH